MHTPANFMGNLKWNHLFTGRTICLSGRTRWAVYRARSSSHRVILYRIAFPYNDPNQIWGMETTITISFAQAPDRPAKALLGPVKESDYLLPYAKYSLLE